MVCSECSPSPNLTEPCVWLGRRTAMLLCALQRQPTSGPLDGSCREAGRCVSELMIKLLGGASASNTRP